MNQNHEISLSDYRALAEIRYQIRRFLRFSERAAREAGLKPQQHQLLLAVKGLPEGKKATIGELAERLQIQHHSAVELIDRMAERGFIQRLRGEADQRKVVIHLTPQGEEVLQKLSSLHYTELQLEGPALLQDLRTLLAGGPDRDHSQSDTASEFP